MSNKNTFTHRNIVPKVVIMKIGKNVLDIGFDILSVSTTKSLSDKPGTFNVELIPAERIGRGIASAHGQANGLVAAYKLIDPGDVISIGFEKEHGSMLGRVESINKSRGLVGTTLTKTIQISGSELPQTLLDDNFRPISNNHGTESKMLGLGINDAIAKSYKEKVVNLGKSVIKAIKKKTNADSMTDEGKKGLEKKEKVSSLKEFVTNALKRVPALQSRIIINNTEKQLFELLYIKDDIRTYSNEAIEIPRPTSYQNNSIANQIWQALDQEFYEMFWLTSTDKHNLPYVELIIRPKHFDRRGDPLVNPKNGQTLTQKNGDGYKAETKFLWDSLPMHTIYEHEIFTINLGVSSNKTYTAYSIESGVTQSEKSVDNKEGTSNVLIDLNTAALFGYREWNITSQQISKKFDDIQSENEGYKRAEKKGNGKIKDPSSLSEKDNKLSEKKRRVKNLTLWKRNRIYNWNRMNMWFEEGNVSFIGRESVRIGDRVLLANEIAKDGSIGLEGYITEVNHSWGYNGKFETKIKVERCITPETASKIKSNEKIVTLDNNSAES